MASCAACAATRSALLSSSCRAINSRTIASTSSSTSSTASTAAAALKVRGPLRQSPSSSASSSPNSCRTLSTAAAGIHLHPTASLLISGSAAKNNNNTSGGNTGTNFLLASTAALLALTSLNILEASTTSPISTTATANNTASGSETTATGGGGGGGGPSTDIPAAPVAAVSSSSSSQAKEDVQRYEDAIVKDPYQVGLIFFHVCIRTCYPYSSAGCYVILFLWLCCVSSRCTHFSHDVIDHLNSSITVPPIDGSAIIILILIFTYTPYTNTTIIVG